jgi:NADH:ubiquinone oxidoreductase subunit K
VVLVTVAMTHESTDGGLRGLYDLSRFLDTFTVAPLVLFLAATAVVVIATHIVPVLLGWAAALLALLLLVVACDSVFSPTTLEGTTGRIMFLLFALWVTAASILLSLPLWRTDS